MLNISGVSMGFNQETFRLKVVNIGTSDNKFINQLGLKSGDELVSVNGQPITFQNARSIFGSAKNQIKPGDKFEMVVARKDSNGKETKETLKTTVTETKTSYDFKLSISQKLTPDQQALKSAWIGK